MKIEDKRFQDLLKLARMLKEDNDEGRRAASIDLLPPDDVIRLETMMRLLDIVLCERVEFGLQQYEGSWIIARKGSACQSFDVESGEWQIGLGLGTRYSYINAKEAIRKLKADVAFGKIAWCDKWGDMPCRKRLNHEGSCDR